MSVVSPDRPPGVFVSHASADKLLVDDFVDTILKLGCQLGPELLFYSSSRDAGVPSGQDLNHYIRDKVGCLNLVVAIVTPAFNQSAYCLAELGAAWVAIGTLFPLMAPGMERTDLGGVLEGVMVRSLDDAGALDELHDRIADATGRRPSARTWGQYRDSFLNSLAASSMAGESPDPEYAVPAKPTAPGGENGWGQFFESVVDAAVYFRDDHVARNEILNHIQTHTLIPHRYLYLSDAGADNWIRLCLDPAYQHHVRTTEFWADETGGRALARWICDHIGDRRVDFISLGPGDGRKDAHLIQTWLDARMNVLYYPYDISLPLASRAVDYVRKRTNWHGQADLHIKAVLADFWYLGAVREVFRHRDAPNVVGFLGNLGNLDRDLEFLRDLRGAMDTRDLAILELRLRAVGGPPEFASTSSLRFDFGPLEHYLGIPFDESLIKVRQVTNLSAVKNTETTVVSATGLKRGGQALPDVSLLYIHRYDPHQFLRAATRCGFDVVYEVIDEDGAFLECVLRPRPS